MSDSRPAVSVVIPCRNEYDYIEACVRSILAQVSPPGGFEIIVADGHSEDGTRAILERLANEDPRVQVVDNPGMTAPCGRNAGIRKARGRYVAILDAHTEYASDYLISCTQLLTEHPEACCAGGPIVSKGRSLTGQATASAMSHPIGIGNAKHRFPHYEGYAEGACFPVFRREIFDRVGLFDESLVRNQDDDFNFRVARSGERVFISPRARCTYYVRESLSDLFWQYCQYGYWRVAVLRKHHQPASIRQVLPITFYLATILFFVAGLGLGGVWRLSSIALPGIYVAGLVIMSVHAMKGKAVRVAVLIPVCAATMHLAYATGFFWAIVSGRRAHSAKMHAVTRRRRPTTTTAQL